MNALLRGRDGTSGVDWSKATEIGYALLLSPLFGFCLAAILLLVLKFIVRNAALYAEPKGEQPPLLTYAQGACAEITAAATIAAADGYGLPVSTTHVLSSGIAGTMAANGSGLQLAAVRNIAMAWVLTLPAAMLISGSLYWIFSRLF